MKNVLTILLLLLAVPAFAAVPFEDLDDDGIYTPGIDRDMTADFTPVGGADVFVFSTAHIVIPAGATLPAKFPALWVTALGHITVNASLRAPDAGGSIFLDAGGIFIGPNVTLAGKNFVQLYAIADVLVGDHAQILSRGFDDDLGAVDIYGGNSIVFEPWTKLKAQSAALASDHVVQVQPHATIAIVPGFFNVTGDTVSIDGTLQFKVGGTYVLADGNATLSFTDNSGVSFIDPDADGVFILDNQGGPVDTTGTNLPTAAEIL